MPVLEDQVFPAIRRRWPDLMMAHATGSLSARSEWVERTKTDVMEGKVFPNPPRALKPPGKTLFDDMDDDIPF